MEHNKYLLQSEARNTNTKLFSGLKYVYFLLTYRNKKIFTLQSPLKFMAGGEVASFNNF